MCRALAWLELLCSGLRLWEASVSVCERASEREREARARREATFKQGTLITSSLHLKTDCELYTFSKRQEVSEEGQFLYYIQRHVWWLQTGLGLVTLNLHENNRMTW